MVVPATPPDDEGESHRIFWQQCMLPLNNSKTAVVSSRRSIRTASAAVRLQASARAIDVTQLLRRTLEFPALSEATATSTAGSLGSSGSVDALVLVGTLYSVDPVQFEHRLLAAASQNGERATNYGNSSNNNTSSTTNPPNNKTVRSTDPFHVVVTLQPHEHPLQVRDRMKEHLQLLASARQQQNNNNPQNQPQHKPRTIISPKLQWYFVPSSVGETSSSSNNNDQTKNNPLRIPNCIQLDGYSTSLEDEGPESDDEEEDRRGPSHEGTDQQQQNSDAYDDGDDDDIAYTRQRFPWLCEDDHDGNSMNARINNNHAAQREARLLEALVSSRSSQHLLSGYLWKQSRIDPHVWRKMHCVITDEHFWFVTRLKQQRVTANASSPLCYAHHGRIQLQRALLLPSTPDHPALARTPHAWEVVSAHGRSHVFRAPNAETQKLWMDTLSDRILQSFENALVMDAELITADECRARNLRRHALATEPLVLQTTTTTPSADDSRKLATTAILRWGLQVADYREACRYLVTQMPARTIAVGHEHASGSRSQPEQLPLDALLQQTIQGCWALAERLLDAVPGLLSSSSNNRTNNSSRSIDTQCQHVQRYLLRDDVRKGPPPMDLFDALLAAVQTMGTQPPQQPQ